MHFLLLKQINNIILVYLKCFSDLINLNMTKWWYLADKFSYSCTVKPMNNGHRVIKIVFVIRRRYLKRGYIFDIFLKLIVEKTCLS